MDKELLKILVCPVTKGPLKYDKARQELVPGVELCVDCASVKERRV